MILTKSDFLISISLQPNVVNLRNLKLWISVIFRSTSLSFNYQRFALSDCERIIKFEIVSKTPWLNKKRPDLKNLNESAKLKSICLNPTWSINNSITNWSTLWRYPEIWTGRRKEDESKIDILRNLQLWNLHFKFVKHKPLYLQS